MGGAAKMWKKIDANKVSFQKFVQFLFNVNTWKYPHSINQSGKRQAYLRLP